MKRCCGSRRLKIAKWFWWTPAERASEQTNIHKRNDRMAKILVLYHSMYGHIETMANAVAEGARSVEGAEVTIKRVPETMPAEVFKNAGGKTDQAAEVASPAELPDYDAIIFGTS